jgi:hypothetical protein
VDSERPIKDPNVDRTIECIERFTAGGRGPSLLAAGTYPILHGSSGRIMFFAYDRGGPRVRFTVTLDGQLLNIRTE